MQEEQIGSGRRFLRTNNFIVNIAFMVTKKNKSTHPISTEIVGCQHVVGDIWSFEHCTRTPYLWVHARFAGLQIRRQINRFHRFLKTFRFVPNSDNIDCRQLARRHIEWCLFRLTKLKPVRLFSNLVQWLNKTVAQNRNNRNKA